MCFTSTLGAFWSQTPHYVQGAHCFHEEEKNIFTNYLKSEPHNTPVGDHNDGRGDKGVIHNLTKRTCLPDFASQNGRGEVKRCPFKRPLLLGGRGGGVAKGLSSKGPLKGQFLTLPV